MICADSFNLVGPRAETDTPANVQPVGAGEAVSSMAVSPDELPAEFVIEALLRLRSEHYAKAKANYRTVKDIERAIEREITTNGVKLPLHTPYGTIRKGYDADRYRNPRKYHLLARRTLIGPKKRIVVKDAA